MRKYFSQIILVVVIVSSCSKSEFLEKTPNESIIEPTTIEDFQRILDDDNRMNGFSNQSGVDPNFLLSGSDDYYVAPGNQNSIQEPILNHYKWDDDIYGIKWSNWEKPYEAIFYCNVALDGLKKIERTGTNADAYDNVLGSALFYRSRFYFQLAQVFAPPYNPATAATEPGAVIREVSDVNEEVRRINLQETYDLIKNDLKLAVRILPTNSASPYKTRPSKAAAYAMLAKTCLNMQQWEEAAFYADSCLTLQSTLIDYNTLTADIGSFGNPIPRTNPETIFYSMAITQVNTLNQFGRIDTALFKLYDVKDRRRGVFFAAIIVPDWLLFKGSYDNSYAFFTGIATDEVYLISAEAKARNGEVQAALDRLNQLMVNRWENDGSFVPYATADANQALTFILTERRKELVDRGLRWIDIRRLNVLGANITQSRNVKGSMYTLPPNDKHYALLIPPHVMGFHPDMVQNPR